MLAFHWYFTVRRTPSGRCVLCIGAAVLAVALCLWQHGLVVASVPVNVGVNAANSVRIVPNNALALHTSVYDNQHGNTQLDNRLIEAAVEMLRYPGGSYADIFHWSVPPSTPYYTCCNSGLPDVTQPHPVTPDKGADPALDPPGSAFPFAYYASNSHFANFIDLLDATGTDAMITVNYGASLGKFNAGSGKWLSSMGGQPEEAAAWVGYANADPNIYGTANDVVIGVDDEGINWRTAGYWAKLRTRRRTNIKPWAQADGVYDAANRFLAINHDVPLGIKYWEVGNEINGNGYYATYWDWEQDLHGAYDGSRVGDSALSPTTYAQNVIQFAGAMKKVDPSIKVGACARWTRRRWR